MPHAEKRLSPLRDLRKSVLALRRMNSEVYEGEAHATRRYLRMGGASPLPDDWAPPGHGGAWSRESSILSRESSILSRENEARGAGGRGDGGVRASGCGREGGVMGGLVIQEEEGGGKGEDGGEERGWGGCEGEGGREKERVGTPMRRVGVVSGECWGTPGGLYDREGFLRE